MKYLGTFAVQVQYRSSVALGHEPVFVVDYV